MRGHKPLQGHAWRELCKQPRPKAAAAATHALRRAGGARSKCEVIGQSTEAFVDAERMRAGLSRMIQEKQLAAAEGSDCQGRLPTLLDRDARCDDAGQQLHAADEVGCRGGGAENDPGHLRAKMSVVAWRLFDEAC